MKYWQAVKRCLNFDAFWSNWILSNYSAPTSLKIPHPPPQSLVSLQLPHTSWFYKVPSLLSSISLVKLVQTVAKRCEGSNHEAFRLIDWWWHSPLFLPTTLNHPCQGSLKPYWVLTATSRLVGFQNPLNSIWYILTLFWCFPSYLFWSNICIQEYLRCGKISGKMPYKSKLGLLSLGWHRAHSYFLNILESVKMCEDWNQLNLKFWQPFRSHSLHFGLWDESLLKVCWHVERSQF